MRLPITVGSDTYPANSDFHAIASHKLLALAVSGARYQTGGAMSFPDNCRSRYLSRQPGLDAIATQKNPTVLVSTCRWNL
ncbi:MAG: hypothetical protein ACRCU2_29300 [Planktothrix sp.]